MPSASKRAVTSAEVPAGNSTVISIGPFWGNCVSCAYVGAASVANSTAPRTIQAAFMVSPVSIPGEDLGDLDAAPLARRHDPGAYDRERRGRSVAVHFRRALPAHCLGELLELLDEGIVLLAGHRGRAAAAALENPQARVHIVIRARFFSVYVHEVILGRRGVARVQRGERAV